MAGLYPRDVIDRVREAVDIVEVISSYLPLKKSGANHMALCPFHTEKTPSFSVSQSKQIFHCFGCGEGGNVLTFVMKYENLPFIDAMENLANRAGITLPNKKRDSDDYARLYAVNGEAAIFYIKQLREAGEGSSAKRYLKKRGLDDEAVERFSLGLAPDKYESCMKHLVSKKFSAAEIEKAGIIKKGSSGNYFDRLRGRLIFPIFDERNRPVAFAGRILEENIKAAKYINSPETPIYHKGRLLYGLNWAQGAIREKERAIVVEGYMDMIALHLAGIDNVVAVSGTAFTSSQCRTLRRFTTNFVMLFDGDDAGRKAALRATQVAMEQSVRPGVVVLSSGEDPDTFVKKRGLQAFLEKLEEAKPYMAYRIDLACRQHDVSTAEGRADAVKSLISDLAGINDPIERASYVESLSQRVRIPAAKIEESLRLARSGPRQGSKGTVPGHATASPLEKWVIRIMLDHPDLIKDKLEELNAVDFVDPAFRRIFEHLALQLSSGVKTAHEFIELAPEDDLKRVMRELSLEKGIYEEENSGQILNDFIAHVKMRGRKEMIEKMKTAAGKNQRDEFLSQEKDFRELH
ncbi:MAG: DNA primase [Nitrospinota bacterium]